MRGIAFHRLDAVEPVAEIVYTFQRTDIIWTMRHLKAAFLLALSGTNNNNDGYVCTGSGLADGGPHCIQDAGCTCAVMQSPTDTTPVFEHPLHVKLPCTEEGEAQCKELCVSLAKATEEDEEREDHLCEKVKTDIEHLHVSLFSRMCKEEYQYTGLSYPGEICCHGGRAVKCCECHHDATTSTTN
ncbi:hypothetical protein AAG570_004919 [Ranatra chinensis]|uniref:Uncharacterized protein n=1 Tax=Ranatra chinensis TaxID=642074 RepID=A0ABD0Y0J7_9HEMI